MNSGKNLHQRWQLKIKHYLHLYLYLNKLESFGKILFHLTTTTSPDETFIW